MNSLSKTWTNPATGDTAMSLALRRLELVVPPHRYSVQDNRICIPARSAREFTIAASLCHDKWIVSFDGWHDDFSDFESALQLITYALAGIIRLRIDTLSGRPCRWTVERKSTNNDWVEIYSNAVFALDLGRKKDCVYKMIDASEGARPSHTADQNPGSWVSPV